jgi:hypothetical protein
VIREHLAAGSAGWRLVVLTASDLKSDQRILELTR